MVAKYINRNKYKGSGIIIDGIVIASAFVSIISQSIPICRFSVLAILVMCIFQGIKEPKFFNPYYLFAVAPFSLLVYKPITNSYMMELSVETWIIIIINMVAFLYAVRFMKTHTGPCKHHKGQNNDNLEKHALILISIASISSIYEFMTGSSSSIGSAFTVCYTPALICAMKTKKKTLIAVILGIYIISQFALLSKMLILHMLMGVAIGIEAFYLDKKNKNIAVIYAAMAIVLLIVSFTFGLKGKEATSSDEKLDYYQTYHQIEWNGPSSLVAPYLYLTTSWTNLQFVMQTNHEHTYGLWMAKPLLGYLQMEDKVPGSYRLKAYSSFNTFSFVAIHYLDFGFWLSIIPSILLGLFVGRYYSRYLTTNSPIDIAIYVLIARAVLMMFFSNHFFGLSYPFTIVIMMWLYKMCFDYKI